ncbi:Fur family transcriptional regulator, ferric uptake regulator [Pustulibacterium marinum]|uniref:Fur family transcriptional regulator, ferric uptake regulator n=1 Tax=Pustulibacterium marinum TaxID=1224947 RepID=A0A1I7IT79_9FLAO|nr:transcriptional repressor [Pustulibacterium marinum]SFU76091.1 Fur family transcriptional regulator, ferric uptake regulator [Pustulibacterium marinum]
MRNTIAKTEIQKLLNHSDVALSPSEIETQLHGLCNRVTVYRVLERLEKEGFVHKFTNVDGVLKYAVCQDCDTNHIHHHNHAHFNCTKCGDVTCLETVEPKFEVPVNYEVAEINFTLSGICPKCAK